MIRPCPDLDEAALIAELRRELELAERRQRFSFRRDFRPRKRRARATPPAQADAGKLARPAVYA